MLIQPAAVVGSSTILKRIVSLANNWMFEPILFTISLRYNKKEGLRLIPERRQREYRSNQKKKKKKKNTRKNNTLFSIGEIGCKPSMDVFFALLLSQKTARIFLPASRS